MSKCRRIHNVLTFTGSFMHKYINSHNDLLFGCFMNSYTSVSELIESAFVYLLLISHVFGNINNECCSSSTEILSHGHTFGGFRLQRPFLDQDYEMSVENV